MLVDCLACMTESNVIPTRLEPEKILPKTFQPWTRLLAYHRCVPGSNLEQGFQSGSKLPILVTDLFE